MRERKWCILRGALYPADLQGIKVEIERIDEDWWRTIDHHQIYVRDQDTHEEEQKPEAPKFRPMPPTTVNAGGITFTNTTSTTTPITFTGNTSTALSQEQIAEIAKKIPIRSRWSI